MGSAPGTLESESVDLTYLEQVLAGVNWVPCPASGIVRLSPTPIKILLKLEFRAGKEWGGWGALAFATHHWGAREPGIDWVMPAPPPQILEIRRWSLAQQFSLSWGFQNASSKGTPRGQRHCPLAYSSSTEVMAWGYAKNAIWSIRSYSTRWAESPSLPKE